MILTPTSNFPRWDRRTKRKLTAMMILFSPTLLNGVTLLDPFKSLNLLDQRLLQTRNIFFNLLFPEALSIEIATQTNNKHGSIQTKIGTQPIQRKSRLLLPNIGIQIVVGVLQPLSQDMYWYKDKLKIIKNKTQ